MAEPLRNLAERYIRAVYGGELLVVNELAGDEIIVSYPIFEQLFGTPVLRGRAAVAAFAKRFGAKWLEPQITIHESVAEGDRVVLVWSFRARDRDAIQPGESPADRKQAWGGITVLQFNSSGQVVKEIGEESAPGPFGRLQTGDAAGES
jgi:hypothetical protein